MRSTLLVPLLSLAVASIARASEATDAAKAVNAFTADLLRNAAAGSGNFIVSPASLELALALARAGAAGATAEQMDAVLHLPPEASRAFRELTAALAKNQVAPRRGRNDGGDDASAFELAIANGLFAQKGWSFRSSYRSIAVQDFAAECREVDFLVPKDARAVINAWVDEKTKHRIQDIVPPDLPSPDTRLALANAIHFKASWNDPFQESATAAAPFTVTPGHDVSVRMMAGTHSFGLRDAEDATVVEIPYRDRATALLIVLPKARDGLDAFIAALTHERLAELTAESPPVPVALRLPKFTFTTTFDAAPTLKKLGMTAACDPSLADFSRIVLSARDPMFIGQVLHKAFIALDEKGTEAAAATVVMLRAGSAHPPSPTPVVVDHPFLFLLRERATGVILFAGRVDDPTID